MLLLRCFSLVCAITLLPIGFAVAQNRPSPQPVSFVVDDKSVHATGLTPGGVAAVICAWRVTEGDFSRASQTWRDARVSDSGEIEVAFASSIPDGAFIAVIDVASGHVEMTTGEQTAFERVDLAPKHLRRNTEGEVGEVLSPNVAAMLVVVRAGEGVWAHVAHDGGAGDADENLDGRITTNPADLQPIAGSPPAPKKIRPRDYVLVIDTSARLFAASEVTP